jgi:adenine-specific DNA-methyltransferase
MGGNAINSEGMRQAAGLAWAEIAPDATRFPASAVRAQLDGVLEAPTLAAVLESGAGSTVKPSDTPVCDRLSERTRRDEGIYLTPAVLADALASPVEALDGGEVAVDLSCGAGALLLAVARRRPDVRVVGVEQQPALAVEAAIRLSTLRAGQGASCDDRIYVDDGLARSEATAALEGGAGMVLGNPPYVREKGNRERFDRIRGEHRHLERFWAGRMDLQYLFFHRSLDLVRPGGWLAFLTSAYWLTATNARKLREDLADRAEARVFVDIRSAGVFDDAPGHHTLLSYFERADASPGTWAVSLDTASKLDVEDLELALDDERPGPAWSRVEEARLADRSWAPFVDGVTHRWGERQERLGTPLGQLLEDRQGFVSGADAVNAWNQKHLDEAIERGTPIFLHDDEPPEDFGRRDGTVLRPVLRGSRLEANAVILAAPQEAWVVYLDDEVASSQEAIVEGRLGRFRPILERRREARSGAMPWYRLHWPRSRDEQTRPKLVVPRRASHPCFALDVSASAVSSDCTYLLAPQEAVDPIRYLVCAMVLLNRDDTERYLREFGKTKGEQLEFYSEPLRRLPMPVRLRDGRLELVEALIDDPEGVRGQIDAIMAELA